MVFSSRVAANLTPTISPANSPYIINFYDAYIDSENGTVCMVLEYMNAGSIQNMLDKGEILNENDSAVLAYSVLSALVELHSRNILHRDIKPSNILTDCSGRIKLTDFGIIKGTITFDFSNYLIQSN
jgi:serine/threonine protein kinase